MSQTEEHSTTTTTTDHSAELERSLQELVSLGRLWASYGLNVGKQALQACSRTHEVAAQVLGDLAERITPEQPRDSR